MARIIAVCKSSEKGTKKEPLAEGILKEGYGLIGDAHADSNTHRQVSLLATESIDKMRQLGLNVSSGDFAENFTCIGIDLVSLPVGAQLNMGAGVVLEITQIGKKCHTRCAIYHQVGKCIMPTEGVFAKVIKGGLVKEGDAISILNNSKE
jgi:MOSC domain-containing protein YiiM